MVFESACFTFGIFVGADTEIFYQVSLNLSTLLESYPMTINYYLWQLLVCSKQLCCIFFRGVCRQCPEASSFGKASYTPIPLLVNPHLPARSCHTNRTRHLSHWFYQWKNKRGGVGGGQCMIQRLNKAKSHNGSWQSVEVARKWCTK